MKKLIILSVAIACTMFSFSQNVGINIINPQCELDLKGNLAINDSLVHLRSALDFDHGLRYDPVTNGPYLFGFEGGALGTVGLPHTITWSYNGDAGVRSSLTVDNANANNGSFANLLRFGTQGGVGIGSNRSGAGTNPGGMDFYTNNTRRMLIDNNGVVGIGTTSPADFNDYKLSVNGTVTVDHGNQNIGTLANVLNFGSSSGAAIGSNRSGAGANDHGLDFYTGFTKQMSLNIAGQLGIGTTTPGAKLDVEGNVKIADGTQGEGKVLTSDANGLAYWNGPVACSAGNSGPRQNSDTLFGGQTKRFIFKHQLYDDGGNNYDPSTGNFTVPSGGIYHCSAQVLFYPFSGNLTATNLIYLEVFNPDTDFIFLDVYTNYAGSLNSFITFNISLDVKLNAGDKMAFKIHNASSTVFTTLVTDYNDLMSIHLVR